MEMFINQLEQIGVVDAFDEDLFRALIEKMTVQVDGGVVVQFKGGGEVAI